MMPISLRHRIAPSPICQPPLCSAPRSSLTNESSRCSGLVAKQPLHSNLTNKGLEKAAVVEGNGYIRNAGGRGAACGTRQGFAACGSCRSYRCAEDAVARAVEIIEEWLGRCRG